MSAARLTDPKTSQIAAQIPEADLTELRVRIIRQFKQRPVMGYADHELVEALAGKIRRTPQRIRSARAELAKLGLLIRSGETRRTEANYAADVWRLA